MTDQHTQHTTDPDECLHDGYHAYGTCPEARAEFARERANALRSLADLIEAKPDLAGSQYSSIELNIYPTDADEMAALTRQVGGAREKVDHGSLLTVRRDFGARVHLDLNAQRDQVCEAVVVGTETVEIPDPTVVVPTITVERDVTRWECSPILTNSLGLADARASLTGQPCATCGSDDRNRTEPAYYRRTGRDCTNAFHNEADL